MYYLGGRVLTLDEVKAEMSDERILIQNMESNDWGRIVVNTNSWKIMLPIDDDDVVLEYEPTTP